MKGLALSVFAMQLLRAQSPPTLPAAIQNSFRFSPPGSGPVNAVAAGFDAVGNLYLAGNGSAWPSTTTFLSPTPGEASFYVMKISGPSTSTPQVAYVTAIGPGAPVAMAVDPAGNVYLAGYTGAPDFPTTPGSFQTSSATGGGFLLKLDPSGKKLVYSTLFPYPETIINALAVDASGNAYIAGQTSSITFPTTPGAFQSTLPQSTAEGFSVGFVSEFDPTGAKLLYSTFIGGRYSDTVALVSAIAVDDAGAIHLLGEFGTEGDGSFPFTPNAAYSSGPGFFTILSTTNPNPLYSTALPLVPSQLTSELKVDGSGNSYIAASGLLKINSNGTIGYYVPGVRPPILVLGDGTAMAAEGTGVASFPTRNTLLPCVPNLPQASPPATFLGSLNDSATLTTYDPSGNITFSTLLSVPGGNTEIGALALDQNRAPWVIGLVENQQATGYVTGTTAGGQFPGGPIIDASSGNQFAFMLDLSAVPQGLPAPSCLASGGNFGFAPAAPGALTTLFGSNLGPTIGVQYQLDANGLVPTQLDATTITVGGVPAPILYAQDTQVNFVVPQQISGSTTNICVTRSDVQSCIFAQTAPEWPAIFCVASCNNDPGLAVLNQDGTLNSSSNPASAGSVLQIFGTGMGPYDRRLPDGAIVGPPLANLENPVSAVFSGQSAPCIFPPRPCNNPIPTFPATLLFAGAAPLEVVGVDQINVLIPEAAVTAAATTLTLHFGNSGASAYVWFK